MCTQSVDKHYSKFKGMKILELQFTQLGTPKVFQTGGQSGPTSRPAFGEGGAGNKIQLSK